MHFGLATLQAQDEAARKSLAGLSRGLPNQPPPELPNQPPRGPLASFPVGTLVLSAAAVVSTSWPALGRWLLDLREVSGRWEPWRAFTGHLVHGSWAHLLLDLSIFVPLCLLREWKAGLRQLLLDYLIIAFCVALGIRLLHGEWSTYCGLSGVVYGFLPVALLTPGSPPGKSRPKSRGLGVVAVTILALKSALELLQNGWLFQGQALERALGVVYLPGSHFAGIIAGLCLAFLCPHPHQPPRAPLASS